MHICQISFKPIKNLGNYESATIEATVALSEGESPDNALAMVREWVEGKLFPKPARPSGGHLEDNIPF